MILTLQRESCLGQAFPGPGSFLRVPGQFQGQFDIFPGGQPGDKIKGLEHKADAIPADLKQTTFPDFVESLAKTSDLTRAGPFQSPN